MIIEHLKYDANSSNARIQPVSFEKEIPSRFVYKNLKTRIETIKKLKEEGNLLTSLTIQNKYNKIWPIKT